MLIKANNSEPTLPVKIVFDRALKYSRKHVASSLAMPENTLLKHEVTWTHTLPAIWSDRTLGFMKEAAVEVSSWPTKRGEARIPIELIDACLF